MTSARRPCAPTEIIDPAHYARYGPPHEAWARLREEAPVAWCEAPGMRPFWAVTRYHDVLELSRRPELYRNEPRLAVFPDEHFDTDDLPFRHLINMDPPEHREYRFLLSGHFTPRALEPERAPVARLVDQILSRLPQGEPVDFVTEVAAVMPIAVIAEMLGLPEEDRELFFRWTNESIGATDAEFQDGATVKETADRAIQAQMEYFTRMVEERRRRPTDDLIGLLANAKLDGEWLPELELLSYLVLLVVAGNETTRNAASGGLLALLDHRAELDRLCKEPKLLRPAVEEIVRWQSPVNQFCRTPVQDVELHGQKIRAGENLCLFYGSANRDDSVFDDPFAFRIERWPNRHIGFGVGEHVCLGAHLARLELQELFGALARRLERIEPAGDVERLESSFISGIKHLPVVLELREG